MWECNDTSRTFILPSGVLAQLLVCCWWWWWEIIVSIISYGNWDICTDKCQKCRQQLYVRSVYMYCMRFSSWDETHTHRESLCIRASVNQNTGLFQFHTMLSHHWPSCHFNQKYHCNCLPLGHWGSLGNSKVALKTLLSVYDIEVFSLPQLTNRESKYLVRNQKHSATYSEWSQGTFWKEC